MIGCDTRSFQKEKRNWHSCKSKMHKATKKIDTWSITRRKWFSEHWCGLCGMYLLLTTRYGREFYNSLWMILKIVVS